MPESSALFVHINDYVHHIHRPLHILFEDRAPKKDASHLLFCTSPFTFAPQLEIVVLAKNQEGQDSAPLLSLTLNFDAQHATETAHNLTPIRDVEIVFVDADQPRAAHAHTQFLDEKWARYAFYQTQTGESDALLADYYRQMITQDFYLLSRTYDRLKFFEQAPPKRMDETLCVLAAGPNINSITSSQWAFIKASDSLGLNWFYLHDYTTTFYQIELSPYNRDFVYQALAAKAKGFPLSSTCIFDVASLYTCDLDVEAMPFTASLFCTPLRFSGFSQDQLRDLMHHHGSVGRHLFPTTLLHNAGALSQAISFGLVMGYKRIVLFGVDLYSPGHFFDTGECSFGSFYEQARSIRDQWTAALRSYALPDDAPAFEHDLHPSVSPRVTGKNRELPINQVIACQLEWAKAIGTRIEIANSTTMADILPRFDCAD